MKKLLAEFIERGWIEPSDSEWASPAFIVPKKEKGRGKKPRVQMLRELLRREGRYGGDA